MIEPTVPPRPTAEPSAPPKPPMLDGTPGGASAGFMVGMLAHASGDRPAGAIAAGGAIALPFIARFQAADYLTIPRATTATTLEEVHA
ncbi:MAG TPA: hypothetical protein VKP69_09685 [Isosphaeraceae bacterium]|nr:hypothetical protein [Isosphaeraceae bacterium]